MATPRNRQAANRAKRGISVDFSDTESQQVIDEGDYIAEVDEVEVKTSENSGADYLSFKFKVVDHDKFKGKVFYHNCSLQPQALFNLRGVLEALGLEVPQGAMDLDPADLIGLQCGVALVHETYEGKTKAKPAEFFLPEEGEEETQPKVKPAAAAKPPAPKKKTVKKSIEVDSSVTFVDDEGNEQSGVVTGITDDMADVQVDEDI